MQLPKRNLLATLLSSSLMPSPAEPAAAQATQPGARYDPQAWERDPRWGRDHWRVRRDPIEWPKKERVAAVMAVTFGFPDFSFKVPEGGGTTGKVARIHVQVYGPKFGVWRLLEVLERQGVKASFEINGMSAAQFPDVVKEISRSGHEIAGHNWADNVNHDEQSVDQDRQLIARTIDAIEKATGKRPKGWVAPDLRFGEKSLEHLAAAGIEWHAGILSDDLPYVINVGAKKMLALPHATKQLDDAGFVIGNRRPPNEYLDFLKRELNCFHREGGKMPKMFNFSVHPEYAGRPFFIDTVEQMLVHLKQTPDVWLTTRQGIADWWTRQNYS